MVESPNVLLLTGLASTESYYLLTETSPFRVQFTIEGV
jgi:hypothetical protein